MSDDIKLNPVSNPAQYQQLQQQSKDAPSTDKSAGDNVKINNQLDTIAQSIAKETAPTDDSRVEQIKQAYENGSYTVDHEQLAEDLLAEYQDN